MHTVLEIIGQLHDTQATDRALIERAYQTAKNAHRRQTRYSGDPYFSHVAGVAFYLAKMGLGPKTIAAGLLHDTLEDTELTAEQLQANFGEEILFLVEGVTKLSAVRYHGADRHNESLRKLFVATSQDVRVLLIKLVDRMMNIRTLEYVPKDKQTRIARETLNIYAPIAHRLGITSVCRELEDLAFPYVYPKEYERVNAMLKNVRANSLKNLERERKNLQKALAEFGVRNFHTSCRFKGLYSLYQKLQRKEWNIDLVYDLLAVRVVVPTVSDCYQTLGTIHKIWRPLPGRIKDYIAFPKPNGYQSLHTTVTTPSKNILEVQIRTEAMHYRAEYGVASHLLYKSSKNGSANTSWFTKIMPSLFLPFSQRAKAKNPTPPEQKTNYREQVPSWLRQIGEVYRTEAVGDEEFSDDFFSHRIFVFTPKGDVVDLPVDASPVDFAYAVHSEIGDETSGVKINQKWASLESKLKNGDIVEIQTRRGARPTQKWLAVAKTALAKRKIKNALGQSNT